MIKVLLTIWRNVIVFPQLIIGDFSLSFEQSKAQFAIWSIMASVSRLGKT